MKSNRTVLRLILAAVLLGAISIAVVYRDALDVSALEGWINEAGLLAPLVFMLVYAMFTVLFMPGSVLTILGGVLFGPVLGSLYNLTGATLGAVMAFLVSRYLASDWVAQKAGGRVRQLINGVEGEGWRFVAFVRLVPLFPFNLLNYALGLTKINVLHYLLATYVFMLPGAVAYTYLGYAGREALGGGDGLVQKILLALALLAVVAFLPRLVASIRRGPMIATDDLKNYVDNSQALVLDVRTAEDFVGEQGHIENAKNIAVEELADRLDELADYVEQPIAIVCRTHKRSAQAAMLLSKQGFHDVHVVRDGMTGWLEHGYPVIR